jgi:hypothetical protein
MPPFSKDRLQRRSPVTEETPRCGCQGPECVSSRGLRITLAGLIGGRILPAHGYQNGGSDWCELLLDRVVFRLVVPPLYLGVLEPYLIRGKWFPSHLPLERTESYPNILSCN